MYSMGIAPWFLMIGRFVAGIGGSMGGVAMTNLAWSTTEGQRTSYVAVFMAVRQLGLVVGPAFNLFLKEFDFYLGPFKIDSLSSPGVFLASVTMACEILYIFGYWDMGLPDETEKRLENSMEDSENRNNCGYNNQHNIVPSVSESIQYEPLDDCVANCSESADSETLINNTTDKQSWKTIREEVFRQEIIAVFFVCFAYMFNQGALETALTPLTLKFYRFGELENSWVYLGCGVFIIVMFGVMMLMSKRYADRWILLVGLLLAIACAVFFLTFLPHFPEDDRSTLPLMIVGLTINLTAIPLVAASSLSLLTKLVYNENQGFMQGIRRFMMNMALILGPVWAGTALNLYLFFSVLLVVYVAAFVMMLDSWGKLRSFSPTEM